MFSTRLEGLLSTKLKLTNFLTCQNASLNLSTFVIELFFQGFVRAPFLFDLVFNEFYLRLELLLLHSASPVDVEEDVALFSVYPRITICLVKTSIDSLLVSVLMVSNSSVYLLRLYDPRLAVRTVETTLEGRLLNRPGVSDDVFL